MLCPKCKSTLIINGDVGSCPNCKAKFRIKRKSSDSSSTAPNVPSSTLNPVPNANTSIPSAPVGTAASAYTPVAADNYVFISYKSDERGIADTLIRSLDAANLKHWIAPECIPTGGTYAGTIERAISNCFAVVVLLSEASVQSKQVAKEVERCISHGKLLIPVLLKHGLVFPDEYKYYFSNCQFRELNPLGDLKVGFDSIAQEICAYIDSLSNGLAVPKDGVSAESLAAAKGTATQTIRTVGLKAVLCNCCGSSRLRRENDYWVCEYCGGVCMPDDNPPAFTVDMQMADNLRQNSDFLGAKAIYQRVIATNAGLDLGSAYWGLFLCENQVFFEVDGKGECFPSFYRVSTQCVTDNPNYINALSCAKKRGDGSEAKLKELGERIEFARKKYWGIANDTQPFDIFICFRNDGGESLALATEIYNEFSNKYRIFFSERTLRLMATSYREYEPNIYYGLYTAKIMLLICKQRSQLEGEDGKWVKNEWSRFSAINRNGDSNKAIIPIFVRGFNPADLPDELWHMQGLKEGRTLFLELAKQLDSYLGAPNEADKNADLDEIKRTQEEAFRKQKEETERLRKEQQDQADELRRQQEELRKELLGKKDEVSPSGGPGIANLITKARLELEDGDFDSAKNTCEKISELNIRCAEMWWLRFLISQKTRNEESLACLAFDFYDNPDVVKALRFADERQKATYTATLDKAILKSVEPLTKQIVALPAVLSFADIPAIRAAQSAGAALSKRQRSYLSASTVAIITAAVNSIPALEEGERNRLAHEQSLPVAKRIMALPDNPIFNDIPAINSVKKDYDILQEIVKNNMDSAAANKLTALVALIPELKSKEAQRQAQAQAAEVSSFIKALPEQLQYNDISDIISVHDKYCQLSAQAKAFVDTMHTAKLNRAFAEIEELREIERVRLNNIALLQAKKGAALSKLLLFPHYLP